MRTKQYSIQPLKLILTIILAALIVTLIQTAATEPTKASAPEGDYQLDWDSATDSDGRLLPNAVAPEDEWRPLAWGYPEALAELALSENSVLLWTGEALEVWIIDETDTWLLLASKPIPLPGGNGGSAPAPAEEENSSEESPAEGEDSEEQPAEDPAPEEQPPADGEPATEQPSTEEPPTEDEPATEQPSTEEPPTEDEPPTEEQPTEEQPAEPPPAEPINYSLFLSGNRAVAAGEGAADFCFDQDQFIACDATTETAAPTDVLIAGDGRWLYAREGTIFDIGWVQAQAVAAEPLSIWADLVVDAAGRYDVAVSTAEGAVLAQNGEEPTLYPLGISEPISVFYEGVAPAHIYLYRQVQRLSLASTDGVTEDEQVQVIWESPEGLFVPAGHSLATEPVNLETNGAMKATRACASWINSEAITLIFTAADSGESLGSASLSTERSCNIIRGKINRPFVANIVGEDTWIFSVETHVSY